MSKGQWTGIHTLTAIVFLTAGFFHLLKFNWRLFWNYLTNRLPKATHLPWELTISLLTMLLLLAGTIAQWQPFQGILNLGESAKNSWETPRDAPPIPHMELLSVRAVAQKLSVTEEKAIETLRQAGLDVSGPDQKWKDLAAASGKSPADLYLLLQSKTGISNSTNAHAPAAVASEGHTTGSGLGQKTIAEVAREIGLTTNQTLAILKAEGMEADPQETVRTLADRVGKRPFEIVEILKK
jgi:biotin operon repressor